MLRISITMAVGVSMIIRFPVNSGVKGGEIWYAFMIILDIVSFLNAIDQIWIVIQQLQKI